MIVIAAALPAGIAVAVIAVTAALVALLVRGLRWVDPDEPDPAWWPDFERQLADYVARRSGAPPDD